jgi:hypothetical protein
VFRRPRPSWARLLHRIFEVDPLLCPKCGTEMKVVGVIMEPAVIDKILKHLARTGGGDRFEGRGPPGGGREPAGGGFATGEDLRRAPRSCKTGIRRDPAVVDGR